MADDAKPDMADALANDIGGKVMAKVQPVVDELVAKVKKIEDYLKGLSDSGHQPEKL